jgi:hypothetical protein
MKGKWHNDSTEGILLTATCVGTVTEARSRSRLESLGRLAGAPGSAPCAGDVRSAENSAFKEKLGWRKIRPRWTVPQGSENFAVKLYGEILAVAPSRGVNVQGITRRVGERTGLAGRRWISRPRPCRLRTRVRSAAFEVRRAEFGRIPQRAIGTTHRHTISRREADEPHWRLCTGRSRRAAGMLGFCSARALSSLSITGNAWVLPEEFFHATKPLLDARLRTRGVIRLVSYGELSACDFRGRRAVVRWQAGSLHCAWLGNES